MRNAVSDLPKRPLTNGEQGEVSPQCVMNTKSVNLLD